MFPTAASKRIIFFASPSRNILVWEKITKEQVEDYAKRKGMSGGGMRRDGWGPKFWGIEKFNFSIYVSKKN